MADKRGHYLNSSRNDKKQLHILKNLPPMLCGEKLSMDSFFSFFSNTDMTSFGSLQMLYVQPEAQTVTITNTGLVSIALAQPTAMNFDIGELSITTLATSRDTATFTIRPKANLSIGVYNEAIIVTGCNEASAAVNVSFEVTTLSGRNMASGTGRGGGCNVAVGYALAIWLAFLFFIPKRMKK